MELIAHLQNLAKHRNDLLGFVAHFLLQVIIHGFTVVGKAIEKLRTILGSQTPISQPAY